ncbi:DUF1937 family protein [Bradyrhizobium sp.]|uniref:DUF1937 family protein n=1 Tax=Bradyrhizobium sp. TaxID=376 RepID=UPI0025C0D3A1|nr:DUF1937 family protein [Bradyrhizobium sp.]
MSDLQRAPLCYLATPYSRYPGGIERAFADAARLAAKMILAGVKVYSPIAHTHPLAVHGGLDPLDHALWLPFDEAMMNAARVLIVAHMEGWQESAGIAYEVAYFERHNKPIFDLNIATMVMAKRARPSLRDHSDGTTAADLEADRREFLQNTPLAHGKTPSQQGGSSV